MGKREVRGIGELPLKWSLLADDFNVAYGSVRGCERLLRIR